MARFIEALPRQAFRLGQGLPRIVRVVIEREPGTAHMKQRDREGVSNRVVHLTAIRLRSSARARSASPANQRFDGILAPHPPTIRSRQGLDDDALPLEALMFRKGNHGFTPGCSEAEGIPNIPEGATVKVG